MKALTQPLFIDLPSGLRVEVKSQVDFFIFWDLFCRHEYDEPLSRAVATFDLTPRIVDIGCNVGYFTLLAANACWQASLHDFSIESFEGSRDMLDEYVQRLRDQPVDYLVNKVTYNHGLVGKREGKAQFVETPFHAMNHVKALEKVPSRVWTTEVPYIDVDVNVAPGRIDLLKVDIEGSEQDFVENYPNLLARTRNVLMEQHHEWVDAPEIDRRMDSLGFDITYRVSKGNVAVVLYQRVA